MEVLHHIWFSAMADDKRRSHTDEAGILLSWGLDGLALCPYLSASNASPIFVSARKYSMKVLIPTIFTSMCGPPHLYSSYLGVRRWKLLEKYSDCH